MDFNIVGNIIMPGFTVILSLIIVYLLYRQSKTPVLKNSESFSSQEVITNEIELEAHQNSTIQYGRLEYYIWK